MNGLVGFDAGASLDNMTIQHIGWMGTRRDIKATVKLGVGGREMPGRGFRRAVWDAAFGYVSGFRLRDIAYYVVTRSLSHRICQRAIEWERKRNGRSGPPVSIAKNPRPRTQRSFTVTVSPELRDAIDAYGIGAPDKWAVIEWQEQP